MVQLSRHAGDRDVQRSRRGGAAHTPRGPAPGAHGHALSVRSARVRASSSTPGEHLRLAEGQRTGCVKARRCRRHGLFHRRGEELHGVGDAPGEEIRRTQGRRHPGEIDREVRVLTEVHGLFEPGECSGNIPLAQAQQANAPRGVHAAREVIHGLGNPESLRPRGLSPQRTSLARHGTRRGRRGRARQAGTPESKRSWRSAPSRDATVCPRQSMACRYGRPGPGTLGPGAGSPGRAGRTSPLVVARARARWATAMDWSRTRP